MDERQARLIQQTLMNMDSYIALGVIDDHLLTPFRLTYIGPRNRIVHDYDVLDNRVVYFTARRLMEDARKYIGSVYHYLSEIKDQKG